MFKRLVISFTVALFIYGIVVVLITQYTIRPSKSSYKIPIQRFTRVTLRNERDEELIGWASKSQHKKSVILLHGIRANAGAMLSRALFYLDSLEYNVLLMDQRAHGFSSGKYSTAGYLESRDLPLFTSFIKEKYQTSCGIHGISMGGAAAILSLEQTQPDFLVLEMVYPRLDKAIENRLKKRLGPLSKIVKESMYFVLKNRYNLSPKEVTPIVHFKSYEKPLLLFAGERDYHTTPKESKELFHAVHSRKKELVFMDAAHQDLYRANPMLFHQKLSSFLTF